MDALVKSYSGSNFSMRVVLPELDLPTKAITAGIV